MYVVYLSSLRLFVLIELDLPVIKVASSGSVTWESGNDRVYTTPGAGTLVTLYGTFGYVSFRPHGEPAD
jgi:hypothetical protein